jgi:16S rRNA (cytidine1402-2'-O)-methyltransferase
MLSVIPTPIGNKEDITLRALRLLDEVQVIFCEDTRTTINLLRMYHIEYRTKKLLSFTSHTQERFLGEYIEYIRDTHCWLVSEAGMPWLSDPWKELIRFCREYSLPFEILPWANALLPAVIATPTDTKNFIFLWFPPTKKGRQTFFTNILQSVYPVYIYESVHRITKTLKQMNDLWYTWQVFIARELTKMYEEYRIGTIQEMLGNIESGDLVVKWEFVVWFFWNIV